MSNAEVAQTNAPRVHDFTAYLPALVWLSVLALGVFAQAVFGTGSSTAVLLELALVTILQIVLAATLFPLLGWATVPRALALMAISFAILATPLLIRFHALPLRFVTACAAGVTVLKLWDLHVHALRKETISGRRFRTHLLNVFSLVLRTNDEIARPPRGEVLRDLKRDLIASTSGALALASLFVIPWRNVPLIVEHVVKAPVVFLAMVAMLNLTVTIVRLSGGTMRDFSHAPLLAATPADFWRRYNRVINEYFFQNVFRRTGRRFPALVVMLIFLFSAALHEYVFGIAIGRVQWYQSVFFLLQGIAVAATLRVRPKARAAVTLGIVATIAFNIATSFFFFLSFHQIVRLYANPLPSWLWR